MKKQTKTSKEEITKIQTMYKSTFIKSKTSTAGITLIALVITIIVLLILAAVSIATLTGENGILTQAETARDKTKEAEIKEKAELIITNWNFEKGTGKTFEEYLKEHFDTVVNNGDGTYTVTLEQYEMTVDEDGNVIVKSEIQEEVIEETDIYVILYTDGTLGFSNDETTIDGKTVQQSYGNIKGMSYNSSTCPWKKNTTITTVNILNKIAPTDTAYWFFGLSNLTQIGNISNLKTDKVTDMQSMFNGCKSLISLDITSFNTSNVTNMTNMFYGCKALTELRVGTLSNDKVTNMAFMFQECSSLTSLDLKNFKTNNVEDMQSMFYGCSSLEQLNLDGFNTEKVKTMKSMFFSCNELKSLDLSNFDTSNVTQMSGMFTNCNSLTSLDLTNFDTHAANGQMSSMFGECINLSVIYATKREIRIY